MQPCDLIDRVNDCPFKPFCLCLSDGSRIDVLKPAMVLIGEDSAVMTTAWTEDKEGRQFAKRWRTVAFDHVVRIGQNHCRGKESRSTHNLSR
jgi:hypothetical protein